jgi:hypothetical protein
MIAAVYLRNSFAQNTKPQLEAVELKQLNIMKWKTNNKDIT